RLRDEEKSREAALLPGKRREKRGDEFDVLKVLWDGGRRLEGSRRQTSHQTLLYGTSAAQTSWGFGRAGQGRQACIEAGKEGRPTGDCLVRPHTRVGV
ncbi:hypothetical protein PspLS_10558, partial [Pyricularia sp. CBS 133598]